MVRVIGSLLHRRFQPELIVVVVARWWSHHHALGLIRTDPAEANVVALANIDSLVRSPGFRWESGSEDYVRRDIQAGLDPKLDRVLGLAMGGRRFGEKTQTGEPPPQS